MNLSALNNNKLSKRDLWAYASGEGATSLTLNGINNFGMLFYTQIFGMSPMLAGIALSIATLWDAITDPLMGTYPVSSLAHCTRTLGDRLHPKGGRLYFRC